jgi:galactose-1-phosphate uridylyltransferase
MTAYHEYLVHMPDGTVKQINPLTGTEVWSVPGRSVKPLGNGTAPSAQIRERHEPEDYCDFCHKNVLRTPPEKDRLQRGGDGSYFRQPRLQPGQAMEQPWVFRRVSNLFEIVTLDYWRENYGYRLDDDMLQWRQAYLDTPAGREHVLGVVRFKLNLLGIPEDEQQHMTSEQKLRYADHFFGGSHELIVVNRHYVPGSGPAGDLFSTSDFAPDDHYQYLRFTIAALEDIYRHNRYARYVAVFQNWLGPAGASFDHLHRQLVGLDEWGTAIEWEVARLRENRNIYNELLVNFAAHTNRVIAENDHAIAFVAIGHRFPTLAVYSKSAHTRPFELPENELRDMSDLIHAMHAAVGRTTSCNEEWYYTPRDCTDPVPWHVLLKLRVNTPAGFEGGTRIYINPYSPYQLRDKVVPQLYTLRDQKRIRVKSIAQECPVEPNSLRYHTQRS